jgi:hypothetical protein
LFRYQVFYRQKYRETYKKKYLARIVEYFVSAFKLTNESSSTFKRNPNGAEPMISVANFSMNIDFNVRLLYESTKLPCN